MSSNYRMFVGIDWATEAHQVCVIGLDSKVIEERVVKHTGVAIAQFLDWLTKLSGKEPNKAAVAIEVPRGAMVESLIERGFQVFAINPKQLDRFRDRHTVAGAKDDRLDAFVLADSLRTDEHCFRRARIDSPDIIQIRELSRVDDDLREEMNRLANRLREQLLRYQPQALKLCPAADEPWFWSLLELAPTPQSAARLRANRVQRLLREHRIRRLKSEEVLAEMKAPPLRVAPGTVEAAGSHIALLLPRLRLVRAQRLDCAKRIEALLDKIGATDDQDEERCEHRDVEILRSLPGVGKNVAAAMLAEASQPLEERDYHALRTLGGVAPITRRSGKRRVVVMRRACNARLRNAFYHWGRCALLWDKPSHDLYRDMRARGHRHGRALRTVVDRLLRILVAMMKSRTVYDVNLATKSASRTNSEAVV
ncbi:MAG: IS110 family transposase [Candidatus Coatesbacteria bacterium]|nr:IS110 family transposase [Candidatus Coatesbacteria bacterium]